MKIDINTAETIISVDLSLFSDRNLLGEKRKL